jgi:hypothetical protein
MNIFILDPDCNRYQNLVFPSKGDWAILRQFGGRNLLPSWTAPVVEVLRDKKFNRNLPPSDFPTLSPGVPVFSSRAVSVLNDILLGNGEILPLSCSEGEYYAFNVTTFIDALDESNSEVERFKCDGRIMQINKYVFLGDGLGGATIFKIPESRMNIFVTDIFRKKVIDNGLTGFKFVNVWEG